MIRRQWCDGSAWQEVGSLINKRNIQTRQDKLLPLDCVVAGGADDTVHGKSCRQEVGFLGFYAEDWGYSRAWCCQVHHELYVNDTL